VMVVLLVIVLVGGMLTEVPLRNESFVVAWKQRTFLMKSELMMKATRRLGTNLDTKECFVIFISMELYL